MKNKGRYLRTVAIVLAGWSIALPIYWLAAPEAVDPLDEFEHSKKYAAEVERIGGKMALVGSQLSDGFAGLWHGPTLGLTLATLTVIVALFYFVATRD